MASAIPVTIVGSTGLTGSCALKSLLASPTAFAITSLTRRDAPAPAAIANTQTTFTNRVLSDLTAAAQSTAQPLVANGGVFITALGTTRAQAGGVANQEKIDLVLNRDLAKKAKDDGASTIIVVSSVGADAKSYLAYPKMKGQLEEDVKALGFTKTIIVRPATLLYDGNREQKRLTEGWFVGLIKCARSVGIPTSSIGINVETVGAAIAQLAAHPPQESVQTLYDADLEKLAQQFTASMSGSVKP